MHHHTVVAHRPGAGLCAEAERLFVIAGKTGCTPTTACDVDMLIDVVTSRPEWKADDAAALLVVSGIGEALRHMKGSGQSRATLSEVQYTVLTMQLRKCEGPTE